MQFLRTSTWRLLALAFFALLLCAAFSPATLGGSVVVLPRTVIWWTGAAFLVGLSVKPLFVQTTETLTHEVGHALLGALFGSRVTRIAIARDTSGVTQSQRGVGRMRGAVVSAAGPLASPTFFLFTAVMIRSNLPHVWIVFVLLGIVLVTITTVRNLWGWIVGAVAVVILWQAVKASVAFGNDGQSMQLPAIWSTSSVNAALLLTGFNAGIALRYSWRCRKAPMPNMDENKFGRALGIGSKLGGRLLLMCNFAVTSWAFVLIAS